MPRLLVPLMSALITLLVVAPLAVRAQDSTPTATEATVMVSESARTDARIFVPFTSDGLNSAFTSSEETGDCAQGSLLTSNRDDAWECTSSSNRIYDPCFENPWAPEDQPGALACITSPFDTEVVLVTPDGPLTRQKASPQLAPGEANLGAWELPWALELANGEHCVLQSEVGGVIAGESVYYSCANGGSILGDLNRRQPLWTVSYLANGAVGTTLTSVAVAWN
jgi:hypothetical protein